MRHEEGILDAVRSAVLREPRVHPNAGSIHLTFANGELTMEGEVDHLAAKKLALEAAARVPGVDRIVDRLKERLKEIARSDAPAAERLRLMLLTRVLFRFDSIQHYTQSLNDLLAALRPGLLRRRAQYFDAEAQIFADVLTEGIRSGELNFEDEHATAHALLQATNGLLPYSLSTTELGERAEVEQRATDVANLMLHGLLSRK